MKRSYPPTSSLEVITTAFLSKLSRIPGDQKSPPPQVEYILNPCSPFHSMQSSPTKTPTQNIESDTIPSTHPHITLGPIQGHTTTLPGSRLRRFILLWHSPFLSHRNSRYISEIAPDQAASNSNAFLIAPFHCAGSRSNSSTSARRRRNVEHVACKGMRAQTQEPQLPPK